uniref:BTB domain-containing protein n=1 Tax=Romanomermis culicivorax TaxID=13658 RepID=A0A915J1R0_ROMCU
EFRQSGFLCDIEIVVQEQCFQCHKVVLASSIPYFRSMFSSEMIETRQKTVEIRDISSKAFDLLLQ